ncbi:MAG TPA: DUF4149 domain-containing protein [Vicinamibacterales bacterium]|nr:DUF4149 domain-containing protein [Vicinamibacterales bacterium]
MLALRFVSALSLIVWLGGAVAVAGIVAPAAFGVLAPADAAAVVGESLRRFHLMAYAAGAALIASLVGAALLGPRPVAFWARLWIANVMLAAMLVSGLWINPRVAAMRREAAASERTPEWRASFTRWHRASVALLALAMAGGLVLVYWEVKTGAVEAEL